MSLWCVGLLTLFAATWLTAPQPIDPDPAALVVEPRDDVAGTPESLARAEEPGDSEAGRAAQGEPQTGVEALAPQPRGGDPADGGPAVREYRIQRRLRASQPEADLPKVWIGVRVTPVPAPLAAHIGSAGAMVANVVKDSPADAAGLEQYDVIVKFAGREIAVPQDLPAAVGAAAPGEAVVVQFVRKGATSSLTIEPQNRPSGAPGELKYPEPDEDTLVQDYLRLRGLTLQPGPDGQWLLQDLGSLQEMPDVLKELTQKFIHVEPPVPPAPPGAPQPPALRFFYGGPDDDAAADKQVEIRIAVRVDGSRTEIERDADGKFTVTRVDAHGQKKEATYDSEEALAEGDPAAHELYTTHVRSGRRAFIWTRPAPDAIRKWRQEFQVDVEKRLREALEPSAEARRPRERAAQAHEDALREYRRYIRSGREDARTLIARLDASGAITVIEKSGTKETKYRFDSIEDLKAAEPQLYERLRELLPQ